MIPSARQATVCAVAGIISSPQPGQVYTFTALAAETGCTFHRPSRRDSVCAIAGYCALE